jgi:endoglucanase
MNLARSLVLLGLSLASAWAFTATAPVATTSEKTMSAKTTPARFSQGVSIGHWLAKFEEDQGPGAAWFGPADLTWIASQGFDHVRYPVDGRLWLNPDGSFNEPVIARFEAGLAWARQAGLAVLLDMHFLPGGQYNKNAQDTALFTDPAVMAKAAEFWGKVAARYAHEGEDLRFEILNEPNAPKAEQLNQLNALCLAAIRRHDSKRLVYITSNNASRFDTVKDLAIPADARVGILLHYDEPSVFTHQRTSWRDFPEAMPDVHFPGQVPDLRPFLKPGHPALAASNTQLTAASVEEDFAEMTALLKAKAPGKPLYLAAFGAYEKAPAASRSIYVKTVRQAAHKQGWGWAVWDYKSSFGIRTANNQSTAVLDGLFDKP